MANELTDADVGFPAQPAPDASPKPYQLIAQPKAELSDSDVGLAPPKELSDADVGFTADQSKQSARVVQDLAAPKLPVTGAVGDAARYALSGIPAAGRAIVAIAADTGRALGKLSTGQNPLTGTIQDVAKNMAVADDVSKPLPYEEELAQKHGVVAGIQQGAVGFAKLIPMLAGGEAAMVTKLPQLATLPVIFGGSTYAETGDAKQAAVSGALGLAFPIVDSVAGKFAANYTAKLLAAGKVSNTQAKVIEAGVKQAAMQATMQGLAIPEYEKNPQDWEKTLVSNGLQGLIFGAHDAVRAIDPNAGSLGQKVNDNLRKKYVGDLSKNLKQLIGGTWDFGQPKTTREQNALQKSETGEVLQPPPQGNGEEGGQRGGVEQVQPGLETAPPLKEIQKEIPPVAPPVEAQRVLTPPTPDTSVAAQTAKQIGYNFVPGRQIGSVKLDGLPPETRAKLEAEIPIQWEFTHPKTGITFYMPEGSTREAIIARAAEKDAGVAKAAPVPPVAAPSTAEAHSLIDNSDRPGDFHVAIVSKKNVIAGFQVKSLEDAATAARQIIQQRENAGLPSLKVTARKIIGKTSKGLEFGERVEIPISKPPTEVVPPVTPSTAQQVTSAFENLGQAAKDAGFQKIKDSLAQGKPVTFSKKQAIDLARADSRFQIRDNPDGSATIIGIKESTTAAKPSEQIQQPVTPEAKISPATKINADEVLAEMHKMRESGDTVGAFTMKRVLESLPADEVNAAVERSSNSAAERANAAMADLKANPPKPQGRINIGDTVEFEGKKIVVKRTSPDGSRVVVGKRSVAASQVKKIEPIAQPAAVLKEPWQMTKNEWVQSRQYADAKTKLYAKLSPKSAQAKAVAQHSDLVKEAIDQGKTVPPEVLKDYPELAPKPAGEKPAAAPVVGELKIGDPVKLMGVDSVLADTHTEDGMKYEIFNGAAMGEKRSAIRVTDLDSGNVTTLKQYPDYDAALKDWNGTVKREKTWEETARGRSIYKSDLATENAKDEKVVAAMKAAPSYPKLKAAYDRFRRSLSGKSYNPTVIETKPWGMLDSSSGVMNAKSAMAKTLRELENKVFSESGLPRKKPSNTYRGGTGVDFDKVQVEKPAEAPPAQVVPKPASENLASQEVSKQAVESGYESPKAFADDFAKNHDAEVKETEEEFLRRRYCTGTIPSRKSMLNE